MYKAVLGIIGFLLGFPVSYYFQPEKLRQLMSLPDYLGKIPDLASSNKGDFATPIIMACIVCMILGIIIGHLIDQNIATKTIIHSDNGSTASSYCSHCGSKVNSSDSGDFCENCGQKL